MEDEMILSRPTDRRLVGDDNLPPGPPGAENDSFELVQKDPKQSKKDHVKDIRDSRRRSPSNPRERRSRSRSRGKRRSRGREYSPPDRRRYGGGIGRGGVGGRRSPRDRIIRSPPPNRNRSRDRINRRRDRHDRSRSRDRYRGRRSRSRSNSPIQRRWSPMSKKPPSPALPPPPQYTVPPPQYDAYEAYGNVPYMGQFAAYDYTNQVPVQVPYPPSYPCDPTAWTQQAPPQQQPAPPQPPQITPIIETDEDQQKRDAAIAQEAQNQRDQLKKQRNDYLKRAAALKREMKILKDQRSDLISTTAPPSPTTKGFLEENDRLESQIQKKLSTIENVIDMLSSIIGEEKQTSPPSPGSKKSKKKSKHDSDMDDDDSSSPERLKSKLIESMKTKRSDGSQKSSDKMVEIKTEKIKDELTVKTQNETVATKKINYSFYDPEMHWCLTCDVFPKTAKDYLNHLHSTVHMENMITPDTPWHETVVNDEFPVHPNVSTKRTPIRGLQFFVPSAGWFCKLCNYWMGDLHCASAHLKSRTHWDKYNEYIDQNPHFEVDWIADRQKVYDGVRAKDNFPPPPPQITSVSTTGMDLLESIPLQINNQKVLVDIEKPLKKKKKKSDEKKEKKKKKRSKKRKKDSSSSSSSSSDSSSESEKEKKQKEDRSNSIRVAMRNLLRNESKEDQKQEAPSRGKWTTVQKGLNEPIAMSASSQPTAVQTVTKVEVDRRKDELISQWNTPQPIISASEKKLLEDLKGKLKTKATVDTKKPDEIDSKKRERSPVVKPNGNKEKVLKRSRSRDRRSLSKNRLDRRSKSRERRSRSIDNGRSRDRRSRSRDRGRGRMSPDRRRRRSRSLRRSRSPRRRSRSPSNRYGRRRSYSRSRSRSKSHRIEKPIVRYPEFRPRVPPPESKKSSKNKSENDTDRKKSPSSKKSSSQTGKRLPFIGRMPVFKKQPQGADGEKKEGEMAEEGAPTNEQMQISYDHYDNMGMMMDYDDLMPDPMQFVSLMGAPPPPPAGPPPVQHAEEKDMLPPGIDESEADNVPKPISDAPIPRKGPLPKDFQEALNIIFPGERKPDELPANKDEKVEADNAEKEEPRQPEDIQIVEEMSIEATSIHTDDASQQSVNETFANYPSIPMLSLADLTSFGGKTVPIAATNVPSIEIEGQTFLGLSAALTSAPPPPPPSPPRTPENDQAPPRTPEHDQATNQCDSIVPDESNGNDSQNNASPKETANDRRQEELDDLAMLGIDADDLAAQCM